jgi:hypothetical protein
VTPKQLDETQLPLPLQAIALAQLSPECVSPSLIRSIEQWSTVTPLTIIVHALKQVNDGDNAPAQFRQAMLNSLATNTQLKREPPRVTKQTFRPATGIKGISPTVMKALLAQQRLIAMSDAEYQNEIARRIRRKQEQLS